MSWNVLKFQTHKNIQYAFTIETSNWIILLKYLNSSNKLQELLWFYTSKKTVLFIYKT